jgi:hypothetical protein
MPGPIVLPDLFRNEEELDELLTRPRPALVDFVRTLKSPLLVLGAGGKMGPTLAVLAHRAALAAANPLDIVAVSRFSDERSRRWLETRGVRTLALDLLDPGVSAQLPDAENVLYLVGLKFGTAQDPARTWAINTLIPPAIVERFPHARIVALSTGNVYPLGLVVRGGAAETDPLTPLGEYANAAVARERVFEFCARRCQASLVLLRLNYAVDLRYGVLVDIARKVWAGEPVDVTNGYLNCIWQGDANDLIVRALALCARPPAALNLTGPEILSVRALALRLGELLDRPAHLQGTEAETALLSNPGALCARLGTPPTPLDAVLRWTAHWVQQGGRLLDKPTHFETRDGTY